MLTHVDAKNRPTMVDVGDKAVTTRTATARAVVAFPPDVVPPPQRVGGGRRYQLAPAVLLRWNSKG